MELTMSFKKRGTPFIFKTKNLILEYKINFLKKDAERRYEVFCRREDLALEKNLDSIPKEVLKKTLFLFSFLRKGKNLSLLKFKFK